MKKIFFSTLFTLVFCLFTYPVSIRADNFNARIDEQLITVSGNPGETYTVTINLETNDPSTTVYPTSFDLPDQSSYNTSNTWLTPVVSSLNINNAQVTSLNFALTIPEDTEAGEYYKAVGISDKVYTENSDPVVVSIPVIVQVTANGEETTSSSSSNSSSSNSTATSTSGTLTPTPTKTKTTKLQKPTKSTPAKTIDIFSALSPTSLKTKFLPLKQITNIDLNLTNEGNIYSIPLGSIQVRDKKNNPIKFFSLNPNKKMVLPKKSTDFNYQLDLPPYYFGLLKLDVYLGDINSQEEKEPKLVKTINFLHLDIIPLAIIVITLILAIQFKSKKKSFLLLILIGLLSLVVCYYLSTNTTATNYLSETTSLDVTATVKNQVGLRVVSNEISAKKVMFVSTNPLGSRLFSLSNNSRTVLVEILTPTQTNHVENLNALQSAKPILMMTSGY